MLRSTLPSQDITSATLPMVYVRAAPPPEDVRSLNTTTVKDVLASIASITAVRPNFQYMLSSDMPQLTFFPPAPVRPARTSVYISSSCSLSWSSPIRPLVRCRTRPSRDNISSSKTPVSAASPPHPVNPATDNEDAKPDNSSNMQLLSRRAFLHMLVFSLSTFTLFPSTNGKPATTTATGKAASASSVNAAVTPLLDQDFKPEGGDTGPGELEDSPFLSNSFPSSATREDYERVIKIPPVDYGSVARSWATTALLLGLPVLATSTITGIQFRMSPRIALPVQYDVYALQRYFSLRPDVVLRRLTQFAFEASSLVIGFLIDRTINMIDSNPDRILKRAQRRAIALRDAITRLGPAVIKLGQAAATRSDLFPSAVVRELQPLQDDVLAEYPSGEAFRVISEELGAPVTSIFDRLDETPVAGASLGMVFKGVIDGKPVAVKVQRPEVATSIALDCYILRFLASAATRVLSLRTDWRSAVDEYASRLFEELDYTNEVKNMLKFRELYSQISGIYIPKAFPAYCTTRVLVTEWVDGAKIIDDMARVRPQDIGLVETGIRFALIQLLDKGFLHADMHNGNMLRTKSGYLAYIDFGLVSDVPACVRESIVCALAHLVHGEYSLLAECFAGLELMRSDDVEVELPALAEALRDSFGQSKTRDFTLVGVASKLLMLGARFPLVFRDYFLNNLRCLGMLEGLALNADPEFRVLDVVYPFIAQRLLLGRSKNGRYRDALEQLVIDSYGRMRWSRIQRLVKDVNAVDSTGAAVNRKRKIASATVKATSTTNGSTPAADGSKGAPAEVKFNNKEILGFIMTDAGGFIRSYVVRRQLMRLQFQWRRTVDDFLFSESAYVQGGAPLNLGLSSVGAKTGGGNKGSGNAIDGGTKNRGSVGTIDAMDADLDDEEFEYLRATTREMSDDETSHLFDGVPVTDRMRAMAKFTPGLLIPLMRVIVGIIVYAIARAIYKLRRSQIRAGDGATDVMDDERSILNDVRNMAVEVDASASEERAASGATEINGIAVPWTPLDSSFVRRTREVSYSKKK